MSYPLCSPFWTTLWTWLNSKLAHDPPEAGAPTLRSASWLRACPCCACCGCKSSVVVAAWRLERQLRGLPTCACSCRAGCGFQSG
eukprot:1078692-Pelagomonas_calceolata.AAC.1